MALYQTGLNPSYPKGESRILKPVEVLRDCIPIYTPNCGSQQTFGVAIASLPHPDRRNAYGQVMVHPENWRPYVAFGGDVMKGEDSKFGMYMNVRSARLFARAILDAADQAEALEISMGWHPAQAVR